jgi:hypothetical protein
MTDLLERTIAALIVGGAVGVGLGIIGRLLILAWRATPSVQRREQRERSVFDSELRAFHDARPITDQTSDTVEHAGTDGLASRTPNLKR